MESNTNSFICTQLNCFKYYYLTLTHYLTLQPSLGVSCWTWEPIQNFEMNPLFYPWWVDCSYPINHNWVQVLSYGRCCIPTIQHINTIDGVKYRGDSIVQVWTFINFLISEFGSSTQGERDTILKSLSYHIMLTKLKLIGILCYLIFSSDWTCNLWMISHWSTF